MSSMSNYYDISSQNREVAEFFLCRDDAVNLIASIEGDVKEWVDKRNKQYWEPVRFVCEQRGLLGKKTKSHANKLTRADFANVLVTFCPGALEEGETATALKASMEKYRFKEELKKLNRLPDAHLVWKDIQDVKDLLDKRPVAAPPVVAPPTPVDRVLEYQREVENNQLDGYPRWVVKFKPVYKDIHPTISVETYISKKFQEEGAPSHIDAYEFIDVTLSIQKLHELAGQYYAYNLHTQHHVKLYIVSPAGLYPDVKSAAHNLNIGYVRLNPNRTMTPDDYLLPRTVNENEFWRLKDDKLMLRSELDIPLLIMDGNKRCTSFVELFKQRGLKRRDEPQSPIVPYMSSEEIEAKAKLLTEPYETCLHTLAFKKETFQMAIDPFNIAHDQDLSFEWGQLDDERLGQFDVRTAHVILNGKNKWQRHRVRFTMAHELGHYVLHTGCLRKLDISAIDETAETLVSNMKLDIDQTKRMEYQANLFASYLLMPSLLTATLYAYYDTLFTGQKPKLMYYNIFQHETWPRYNHVVGNIARRLNVSMDAVKYRLIGMNFLKTD